VELKHLKIKVSGKVQGVFYRASAKAKADEWNIKGFVRNEPNGDVYLEAEAREEILYKFVKWCSQGPADARVEHIEATPGEYVGYPDFLVLRG
jgi:acylphosphatase